MGCDIHYLVQTKRENGEWKNEGIPEDASFYGRNYELFAILASVRNYYGIKPICTPKGLPLDLSEEDRENLEDIYTGDAHSFSYYSLKDIKEYDWDQIVTLTGIVKIDAYRNWMKQGKIGDPEAYSKVIFGPLVLHISNDSMENIITSTEDEGKEISETIFKCKSWPRNIVFCTNIRWDSTCKELCPTFYNNTIPALQKLSDKYGGPENVRIVFSFDN
jgi:hypothetical protein